MSHIKGYRTGASLQMWRDYFPAATIYGLDIDRETVREARRLSGFRIATGECDQRSVVSLEASALALGNRFDLIVDDGSHDPGDQLRTYICLSPLLRPGGLYIIEDVAERPQLPVPYQYVECRVPDNDAVGRCVVIQSS